MNSTPPQYTFVLTGIMSRPREEIVWDIKAAGHLVKGSVVSGVTHLVQADPDSRTVKTKKALALGVEIIGEDQLVDLIG